MVASYFIYIGTLFLCWFLARLADQYNQKKLVWAVVLLLTLVAGLRAYSVGIDTQPYVDKFEIIKTGELQYAYGLEESFKYICYALLSVFRHNSVLLAFFALITHFCIIWRFWELRNVSAFGTMVACYYMGSFFLTLNTMRQFCAIAIVFYCTKYLVKHENFRFLFGVLIASLFHQSGLIGVALVAFGLLRWKELTLSKKVFFIAIIATSPLLVAYILLQMVRYEGYFLNARADMGIMVPIKILFFVVTLLFVFLLYRKEQHFADWNGLSTTDKNSIILGCIGYGIGLVLIFSSYFLVIMNRVGWYFTIFEGFYMGMLVRTKHKLHRYVFGLCAVIIVGYGFYTALTGNDQGQMPYLFIWQA